LRNSPFKPLESVLQYLDDSFTANMLLNSTNGIISPTSYSFHDDIYW